MPNDEPPQEEATRKLKDLTPKEDPQGGSLNYSRNPPLEIPPPGFFVSSRDTGTPNKGR
jgi:hypothetical protein